MENPTPQQQEIMNKIHQHMNLLNMAIEEATESGLKVNVRGLVVNKVDVKIEGVQHG